MTNILHLLTKQLLLLSLFKTTQLNSELYKRQSTGLAANIIRIPLFPLSKKLNIFLRKSIYLGREAQLEYLKLQMEKSTMKVELGIIPLLNSNQKKFTV